MNDLGPSIFACFGRSFDCQHKMSGKIHLTSSIIGGVHTMTDFLELLFSNLREAKRRKYDFTYTSMKFKGAGVYAKYLFIVNREENIQNYVLNIRKNIMEENLDKYEELINLGTIVDKIEDKRFIFGFTNNDITVVFISLHELIANLQLSDEGESLFKNIFGKFEDVKKDHEAIFNNSLFIFRDYHWWFIVLMFKIQNVNISGGRGNKRHLINSVEVQLINFLNIFGFNTIYSPLDKKLSKGYLGKVTNLFLSNKIPLNEIEKIKKFKGKLNKQKLIEIQKMINTEEKIGKNDKDYYKFLIENILYCNNYLILLINNWFYTQINKVRQLASRAENQMEQDKLISEYYKLNEMQENFREEESNYSPNELNDIFEYLNNLNKSKSALPKYNLFPFYKNN